MLHGIRILVPPLGTEPVPSAVEVWRLNNWTTGEVPTILFFGTRHPVLSQGVRVSWVVWELMCRMSPFWAPWGQYPRECDHWSDYDLGHKICVWVVSLSCMAIRSQNTLQGQCSSHVFEHFFSLAFLLAFPLTVCLVNGPSSTLILFVSRPLNCFVVYVKSQRSLPRFLM